MNKSADYQTNFKSGKITFLKYLFTYCCIVLLLLTVVYVCFTNADLASMSGKMESVFSLVTQKAKEYEHSVTLGRVEKQMEVGDAARNVAIAVKENEDNINVSFLAQVKEEQRLSGIIITDKDLNLIMESAMTGMNYETWKGYFANREASSISSQPSRIEIHVRNLEGDNALIFGIVPRIDQEGVIICYKYLAADLRTRNQIPVKNVLLGTMSKSEGTIYLIKDKEIVSSSDTSYVGKKIVDYEYLYELERTSSYNTLTQSSEKGIYLAQTKCGEYTILVEYPKDVIFSSRQNAVVSLFIFSVIFIIILFVISSRSSQRQLMKDLEYQEKLKNAAEESNLAKSRFLSRMSHDIRTPLNGIIGVIEIDEKHPDDIPLITENRQKAKVAASHLLSLINDVLDMSKLEDGQTVLANDQIDLKELLQEVITITEMRAKENGISLKSTIDYTELPFRFVFGSPLHIRRVLVNIIGNAIKYSEYGGLVTFGLETEQVEGETVYYRFTVQDNGIGMSEDFIEHIFEPFSQEKVDARSVYHGTGLGMAISKSLVDKMGGDIKIISKVGVGSTFHIIIPLKIVPETMLTHIIQEEEEANIQGMDLLLVEDNELNMMIAQFMLEDAGANITMVRDGKQALDTFLASEPGTFDAILMDVMMPVMDGLEATRMIRASGHSDAKTIPIIAMTANAFSEDVAATRAAGMNEHLAKPLEIEKLIATVASFRL